MNKKELIRAIAAKTGQSLKEVKKTLEAFTDTVGNTLAKGDRVRLIGFGTFSLQVVPPRTLRNPQTGQPIKVGKKKKVRFKAGAELSSKVN